jgi:hypothetical protein
MEFIVASPLKLVLQVVSKCGGTARIDITAVIILLKLV